MSNVSNVIGLERPLVANLQVSSGAAEDRIVFQASACALVILSVSSKAAGALWLQVHDAAALPSNGAVPIISLPVAAGGAVSITAPLRLESGFVAALSSTMDTLTVNTGSEGHFFAQIA